MLPKNVSDLADLFVKVFDDEHPFEFQLRCARVRSIPNNDKMPPYQPRSSSDGGVYVAGKHLKEFFERRLDFIRDKLQEAIVSTRIPWYPDLADDTKQKISSYYTPQQRRAEIFLAELATAQNTASGYTRESLRGLYNALAKVHADVEMFCAKYATEERMQKEAQTPTINYVNTVSGHNARVNIGTHDLSINIANSETIFSELRKAIEANVADKELSGRLVEKTTELEAEIGKPSGWNIYSDLVALGANHMTVIGPFIPALTELISQQKIT
jgi:hypothetical protein